MDVDTKLIEQGKGKVLIRASRGNAQHGVPTAFYFKPAADSLRGELTTKFLEIPVYTRHQLLLKTAALRNQRWHRQLHGSVHRKIGVCDDFEPRQRFLFQVIWTGDHQPGSFHLRQAANL